MAKEDKARVRVFFGEIDGDNETVKEALRSIASAVNKTFSADSKIIRVIQSKGGDSPSLEELEEAMDDEVDVQEGEIVSPKKPVSKSKAKAPTYSFVKELNLMPEGKESLVDFFAKKAASNQQDQFVVIVYYLQHILGMSGITPNHIYTCLKDVKISVPTDIGKVARNTANRKNYLDTSDSSNLRVTVAGENFVERKLGVDAQGI